MAWRWWENNRLLSLSVVSNWFKDLVYENRNSVNGRALSLRSRNDVIVLSIQTGWNESWENYNDPYTGTPVSSWNSIKFSSIEYRSWRWSITHNFSLILLYYAYKFIFMCTLSGNTTSTIEREYQYRHKLCTT